MSRKIAIGDIHGGLKALVQLLRRVDITPEDEIIFLGDYVDGWSDSANVVSYLIELAKQNTCIFIRGNHDDLVHRWLKTGELNEKWLQHGGQSSMDAYRNFTLEEKEAHIEFFQQMMNYYIDKQNRLFVHAGFTNQHGPQSEYHNTGFYWDRTLWETVLALDPKMEKSNSYYPKRLQLFEEIYIGHTPVTRIDESTPFHKAGVWNVDTGAAFKGKLSAIEVNTKEVWQSDPIFELYPNENGRN
ncbi:metallophosphoesterase family protein [Salegentibacter sp. F188]|uniref:Metallophosphoesterase family protein n=1 Tax=Autumnicola patrickiae TaxID=3075591 RepID=A0ABU3E5L0_9FLAO|nr:metallophosphoesterase family protein [Salegentibacter sp. F188]MDT0691278.1 metallophosphoesterase family protein [Salegentibacter sp. F188]